eukprot:555715-Amphidinium_carterae.1
MTGMLGKTTCTRSTQTMTFHDVLKRMTTQTPTRLLVSVVFGGSQNALVHSWRCCAFVTRAVAQHSQQPLPLEALSNCTQVGA